MEEPRLYQVSQCRHSIIPAAIPSFPRKREPTKWLAARQSRGVGVPHVEAADQTGTVSSAPTVGSKEAGG